MSSFKLIGCLLALLLKPSSPWIRFHCASLFSLVPILASFADSEILFHCLHPSHLCILQASTLLKLICGPSTRKFSLQVKWASKKVTQSVCFDLKQSQQPSKCLKGKWGGLKEAREEKVHPEMQLHVSH